VLGSQCSCTASGSMKEEEEEKREEGGGEKGKADLYALSVRREVWASVGDSGSDLLRGVPGLEHAVRALALKCNNN